MLALLKKELQSFFSSLTAYLVLIIFLLVNGLFLWVFSGDTNMNIFDSNYASLDGLFFLAPWIFLFLVPAITMRMFADEVRTGTFELLLTHPLTDIQIVLGKYLATLILVLFSILPTLLYFLTVYLLGNPIGDIDTGATWGAYIGLFFLAAIYGAIGVFVSSLSENQIVAFLFTLMLCFIFYIGFDFIGSVGIFKQFESVIIYFGISEHYNSISRGVVDARDLIYYLSVSGLFLYFTKLSIEKRRK